MKTSDKSTYAVAYDRLVQFFARPPLYGNMRYRHPIKFKERKYKTKGEAQAVMQQYNTGLLI